MATPLLSYQLNPSPEPLMASPANPAKHGYNQSVLTLTASNATTQAVTLTYLRLDLPLGSGATDLLDLLTLDALLAAVSVTPDPAWTLAPNDGVSVWTDANKQVWGSYLFHPSGDGTLPVDNSWTFSWQGVPPTYWGVPVNTVPSPRRPACWPPRPPPWPAWPACIPTRPTPRPPCCCRWRCAARPPRPLR